MYDMWINSLLNLTNQLLHGQFVLILFVLLSTCNRENRIHYVICLHTHQLNGNSSGTCSVQFNHTSTESLEDVPISTNAQQSTHQRTHVHNNAHYNTRTQQRTPKHTTTHAHNARTHTTTHAQNNARTNITLMHTTTRIKIRTRTTNANNNTYTNAHTT